MLKKVEQNLKFNNKRNHNLVTPCCKKRNKDGKFVNYKGFGDTYGYCHSCGKTTLPPQPYTNEKGELFYWNETTNSWNQDPDTGVIKEHTYNPEDTKKQINYVPEADIWKYFSIEPENNLLQYLRGKFPSHQMDDVKKNYVLGSTKDGGTVFWMINKRLLVQKAKISYFNYNGKRTNKFKVPYKNGAGYYSCLFGEHLLPELSKGKTTVVLVESEKTAIVGSIMLPKYVWLAYGGINGLTESKIECLHGHKVLLVPDISEKAVDIAYKKLQVLEPICKSVNVWDMTEGKTDVELKALNIHNNDLEDYFRKISVQ
ncbi:MAG: DUF6371 domain-containing protein [Candidatus Paceibacterota bacterium]